MSNARASLLAAGAEIRFLQDLIAALKSQLADRDAEIERLRAKLDSEASHRLSLCADNERFIAEIERLRADLVWAARNSVYCGGKFLSWWTSPSEYQAVQCDGTPDSICRAVREARDGE